LTIKVKFDVIPTGGYNKSEICKMAASRFVEIIDKEVSEIKINPVSVIIGEYSDYSPQEYKYSPQEYIGEYKSQTR
jgi:hypothetical protein